MQTKSYHGKPVRHTSHSSRKLMRVKMSQVLQLWEKKSLPVIAAAKMIVIQLDQSHLFQASHPLSPEDSASLHYLLCIFTSLSLSSFSCSQIFEITSEYYSVGFIFTSHIVSSLIFFIKPKAIFELHAMLYVMMAKLFGAP